MVQDGYLSEGEGLPESEGGESDGEDSGEEREEESGEQESGEEEEAAALRLTVGMNVRARPNPTVNHEYFDGVVRKVHQDGTADIEYDVDDPPVYEERVRPEFIKPEDYEGAGW